MRLQEVYAICKNAQSVLNTQRLSFRRGGLEGYVVSSDAMGAVMDAVEPLEGLPPFEYLAEAYYQCFRDTEYYDNNYYHVSTYEKNKIERTVSALSEQVNTVCGLCEFLRISDSPKGFNVKLPSNLSLSDFSKCISDLDKIFSACPFLRDHEGKIVFQAVDIGSAWLAFGILGVAAGAVAVLNNFSALVDTVVRIRSHLLTLKQQEESLRTMVLSNDALETIIKNYNEISEKMKMDAVTALSDSQNVLENEERERVKWAVNTLLEWFSRGMEIYAAIGEPPEVRAVFPPVQKQALTEIQLKLLDRAKDKPDDS